MINFEYVDEVYKQRLRDACSFESAMAAYNIALGDIEAMSGFLTVEQAKIAKNAIGKPLVDQLQVVNYDTHDEYLRARQQRQGANVIDITDRVEAA